MNQAQIGLFILYAFSVLSCGIGTYVFLDKNKQTFINRSIFLGESLLLGSIFLVGQLLLLSLIGLYKMPYLWGVVVLNYTLLFNKNTRNQFFELFTKKISFNIPTIIFIILVAILIFRNCYFLIDVDSQTTYLFTQRFWLLNGTSIAGNITTESRIFVPQFDFVPASLGISIFRQETFFPELVNLLWRLIVLLLVFGYTSYRFNKYYGLATAMFVIFNDHFFYSGVNHWVLINGAVIAFLFASAYNLWESRRQDSSFRFLLALIFLSQLPANKYQMAYVSIFIFMFGISIQPSPIRKIKEILFNKKRIFVLLLAVIIMSFWYLKNYLVTGDPVFPILAGRFHAFNWTADQEHTFIKVFGGLNPLKFFKYISYLFIWPGVNPAKFTIATISLLPLIFVKTIINSKIDKDLFFELSFWLGLSILAIMGICLSCHQDPRYYRYPIGILSFTAVLSLHYILKYCFNIKKPILISGIILLAAMPGYNIMYQTEGYFIRPTFKENIDVLFNRIHTDYAIKKHYPEIEKIIKVFEENKEKIDASAWDEGSFNYNMPQFLLPIRPVVSMWFSTTIKWDSYSSKKLIIKDLKSHGILWIMQLSLKKNGDKKCI